MLDYFALLRTPRRPWLDADSIKQTFFTLSAELHPDRVHTADAAEKHTANERSAELNAAYQCLREPRERLRHLLELELRAQFILLLSARGIDGNLLAALELWSDFAQRHVARE